MIRAKAAVQNNVKLNMPRLEVGINRDRASTLGISAASIEQALALAFAGGYVSQFTTDQDQYQVIAEVDKSGQRLPEDLGSLYLRSLSGRLVPMTAPARWPGYFRTPAEKNAWNEREELRNARRAAEKSARAR